MVMIVAVVNVYSIYKFIAGSNIRSYRPDKNHRLSLCFCVTSFSMTCTNMEKDGDPKLAIENALKTAKANGVRNIVALRGDPAAGQEEWTAADGGFTCALDLVEFMKEKFGDEFGISVAGYPEGHPNAISEIDDPTTLSEAEKGRSSTLDGKVFTCRDEDYKKEMDYLKKKVDAGAGTFYKIE